MTKTPIDREQWIIARQMSTAVMTLNSAFCDDGPAEGPNDEWLQPVCELIADETSIFALEDAIYVLQQSLDMLVDAKKIKLGDQHYVVHKL